MVKTPLKTQKAQRGDTDDSVTIFSSVDQTITIKGNLFYHEGGQAWNTLRLKKEILHEFPHLKDKSNQGIYIMTVHRSYNNLKKEIEEMEKSSNKIPIILFLGAKKAEQKNI